MKRIIAILGLAAFLSGCATVTATPDNRPKLSSTPAFDQTQDFYVWGLVPDQQTVKVSEICPNGVRQVQAQTTFFQGFVGVITLGIYTPRSAKVWCEE